jgi:hypothetical protein
MPRVGSKIKGSFVEKSARGYDAKHAWIRSPTAGVGVYPYV